MSFIDDWRLMVKESLCDECRCEIERSDEEVKERLNEIREQWHDPKYKLISRDELWKKENKLNKEVYEKGKSICFVFRADCGGDGFSLCKKHLLEIIKRIDELK